MITAETMREELKTHKTEHKKPTQRCLFCWLKARWRMHYAAKTLQTRTELRGYVAPSFRLANLRG